LACASRAQHAHEGHHADAWACMMQLSRGARLSGMVCVCDMRAAPWVRVTGCWFSMPWLDKLLYTVRAEAYIFNTVRGLGGTPLEFGLLLLPRTAPTKMEVCRRPEPPRAHRRVTAASMMTARAFSQFFSSVGAASRTSHFESRHYSPKWRLDMQSETDLGIMPPAWSTSSKMDDPRPNGRSIFDARFIESPMGRARGGRSMVWDSRMCARTCMSGRATGRRHAARRCARAQAARVTPAARRPPRTGIRTRSLLRWPTRRRRRRSRRRRTCLETTPTWPFSKTTS
jgi:hypothetical protein